MKEFGNTLKIILVTLVIAAGAQYAFAVWTPPTATPPSGNVPAPINVGNIVQEKLSGLIVGTGTGVSLGLLVKNGGLVVENGNVGIGTSVAPSVALYANGTIISSSTVSRSFCLGGTPGTNCISTWPTGGTGGTDGVTKIIAGSNINISSTGPTGTGDVTIHSTATGGTSGITQIRVYCGTENPASTDNLCPSGWTFAGTMDNDGAHWCFDSDQSDWTIGTASMDSYLCFR